jgi:hypothetical protein
VALQRGAQRRLVAERPARIADDLVVLVALAGDQHDIADARRGDRKLDRGSAVMHDLRTVAGGQSADDVRDDSRR